MIGAAVNFVLFASLSGDKEASKKMNPHFHTDVKH